MKKAVKGSFTVEATIVIFSMLMALLAVMYAFMVMYQNVIIIYAASYGAQQGARAWNNTGISMDGTQNNYNSELYADIAELGGGGKKDEKINKIKEAVNEKLKLSIMSKDTAKVDVSFKPGVLQRKVIVEINQKIPIPFSGIVKYFNNGKPFAISAKMEAVVAEPCEYIRNIDYAFEWVMVTGKWLKDSFGDDISDKAAAAIKGLK